MILLGRCGSVFTEIGESLFKNDSSALSLTGEAGIRSSESGSLSLLYRIWGEGSRSLLHRIVFYDLTLGTSFFFLLYEF